MNNWKNIILPQYEIRKSAAQKTAFINMLKDKYGDSLTVEETKGLTKSRNLIFGDPAKAKTVFTAHYDTCVYMPFPNFITPMNLPVYILYQLLIVILIYIPLALIVFGVSQFTDGLADTMRVVIGEVILFGYLFLFLFLMRKGPANKHTANDNTSGVVTVLTLLDKLGNDPDYAFILFDNEEMGLKGSKAYAKAHPEIQQNSLIVNFDCVSDGDNIMLLPSKNVKTNDCCNSILQSAASVFEKHHKLPIIPNKFTFYPSDQAAFKKYIAVSALKKSKIVGYYMDKIHTNKDVEFDERNINAIIELFSQEKNAVI